VNGTVDTNSLTYNGKSLDFGYTGYDGSAGVFSRNLGAPVYDFPGIEGPANRAGAAQIGASQLLINEFAKQAAFQALGGLAGRLIGAGIDAGLAARAAAAQAEAVQFGKTATQVYHVFRHLQEAGVNVEAAKDAILNDIATKGALSPGLTTGTVNVGGRSLTYNAFKLADGTINVGRITVK
jgi:hypothetical protein